MTVRDRFTMIARRLAVAAGVAVACFVFANLIVSAN
jgi:hypothetical protein